MGKPCYITDRMADEIQGRKRPVKRFAAFWLFCCSAAVLWQTAQAQAPFPSKPIRVVVPFGPGGLADITMRLLGQKLAERTGQQVVIENRPSAGGIVAANAVITAAPDGYTLFVLSSGIVLSTALLKTMPFDPKTAFAPISTVAFFDLLLLAKADSPMHSTADMLAAAKANPSAFNIGTINPGSTQNIAAELIKSAAGIPMTVVPYRNTGEVLTSLLRGDTQIGVESYAALKSPIDSGQIRAVAATGETRSPMQPNVPTLKEGGVDAVVLGWNSLAAPAQTPKEIVAAAEWPHPRHRGERGFQATHPRSRQRSQGNHAGRAHRAGRLRCRQVGRRDQGCRHRAALMPATSQWSFRGAHARTRNKKPAQVCSWIPGSHASRAPRNDERLTMANELKIDAHVHVFTTDMPLVDNPRHAPTYSFTHEQLIATLDANGVERAVIAAASPWGDYNDYTLAALRAHKKRLRGTVIQKCIRGILFLRLYYTCDSPFIGKDKFHEYVAGQCRS